MWWQWSNEQWFWVKGILPFYGVTIRILEAVHAQSVN
jgi:hypothetical protein